MRSGPERRPGGGQGNYPAKDSAGVGQVGDYPGEDYPGGNYQGGDYPGRHYPGGWQGDYPVGNYPEGDYPEGNYPERDYTEGDYQEGDYSEGWQGDHPGRALSGGAPSEGAPSEGALSVDCQWSSWSSPSSCTKSCSGGKQEKTRHKTVEERYGGTCSGSSSQINDCNIQKCQRSKNLI